MAGDEDSFTLTGVGDAIITRALRTITNDRFRGLVDLIRDTDAAVVNLETLLHDYEGYPSGAGTNTFMRADPAMADELTWAGFDAFSVANNHAFDYTYGGMEATMRALEERGIPYAGMGRNLRLARKPAYVDTPGGRVALVAANSTFYSPAAIAGRIHPETEQGRPGVSPLRYKHRYVVPPDAFEEITRLSSALGLEWQKERAKKSSFGANYPGDEQEGVFTLPTAGWGENLTFERGDEYRIYRAVDQTDVSEITQHLDAASRQADWVVMSHHAHESPNGRMNTDRCARFQEEFARACIDAGADAFFGHGAQVLQGIDLYDGAPIFHDLGCFVYQNQHNDRFPADFYERFGFDPYSTLPADVFDARVTDDDGNPKGFVIESHLWESVLPLCEFEDGGLREVTLVPYDLMQEQPRPGQGRPRLAAPEKATAILERLADLSEPYGTTISIEDATGHITPD